jgi:drug/metabolite transporter (DMT)-like permease
VALSIAPLLTAVGNVLLKRIALRENPLALNIPPMIYCAAVFFVLSAFLDRPEENHHTFKAWLAILYLGTVGTAFVFGAYFTLLRWFPVTRLAFIAFVTPLIAVFLGWAVAGERLGWRHAAGAVLVILGVALSGMPYRAAAGAREAAG